MRSFALPLLLFAFATGCVTPPEIKQALNAKDQAYLENQRLMSEYRQLVQNINARHRTWYRFVQTRLKLDLAVQWATTDPKVAAVPEDQLAQDDADLLGPDVVGLINKMRLQGLPERKGPGSRSVFQAGTKEMNTLLAQLPDLIALVEEKVEKDSGQAASTDLTVFDKYQTNVQALRRINAMIKHYLDIDVTPEPGQVQSLAETISTLRH
jgi:hypothetical protein